MSFFKRLLPSAIFRRRVPVLAQLSATDCGATCLTMILHYHGKVIDAADVRSLVGHERGGVSMVGLVKSARTFGLVAKSFSVPLSDLRQMPLPAIAHFSFNHYVVVEEVVQGGVYIVDPAVGRRFVPDQEMDEEFTGVLFTFAPGPDFVRKVNRKASEWRAFAKAYLKAAPADLGQAIVASVVIQFLGLSVPIFTALVLDRVLPTKNFGILPLLGVSAILIVVAQGASGLLRSSLLLRLEARVDMQFVPTFFGHLLGLPLGFFEQRKSGDLLLRIASQAAIRDILTGQTFSLLLDGSLVLGYLALLFYKAPTFGLLVLGLGLVQSVILWASAKRASEIAAEHNTSLAEAQNYLVEMLFGVAAVKSQGAESRVTERFTQLFQRQVAASLKRGKLAAWVDAALGTVRTAGPLAMLWLGASSVLAGTLSPGMMVALCSLGGAFLGPVASIVQNGQRLPLLGTYIARVSDVLNAVPEQPNGVEPAARLRGHIEVRNVGFRYSPTSPWILRGVSLVVEPGETLAIVGQTGCGKTTLLKLLLGLYAPSEGEILYDGRPLFEVDLRSLRQQFGVVLQEPALHYGSVLENIAFGDLHLPLADIEEAAKIAAFDKDVENLPMGYDTPIGEGGSGLSGGQRQRLALARALSHKPSILFLDEATSHLDVVTERSVEQNLRQLPATRVLIAHRLSTVRHADKIVVLEGGEVLEMGPHAELIQAGGTYSRMVECGDG